MNEVVLKIKGMNFNARMDGKNRDRWLYIIAANPFYL
jgi:hypothetical protein